MEAEMFLKKAPPISADKPSDFVFSKTIGHERLGEFIEMARMLQTLGEFGGRETAVHV